LPAITDPVVIDATTQAGYAGTPIVELRGDLAGAGVSGLRLETGGNTLKGLAINRFAANGIFVLTGGGNTIQGNFLGTNLAGTAAAPNARNGIDVRTAGNTIGGAGLGEGNLISGNTECGILTLGGGSSNVILGNRIGTNQAGTAAVANGQFGIYLTTPNNQVGGTASGAGNLISGNRSGVAITESTATGNALQGNRIGTSADGSSAVSNVRFGVTVANNTGNTVGGTEPGSGNVVSGNSLYGVLIVGPTTKNNKIQGNLAGLNAAGTTAVPNGQIGVAIFSPDTLVGGPGGGNVISGNLSGVWVGTAAGTGAIIQGNLIGTDVSGTLAVPNQHYGVYVSSPNNLVGGVNVGEGNVISGNKLGGVALTEVTAHGNVVQGNRIGTNAAGTAALGNGHGVTVANGSNNTVGGTVAGAGNQISGNTRNGVMVVGSTASGTVIRNNLIGLNASGTAAMGNGLHGVAVWSSPNTTLGGAGSGNTISANAGGGVIVYGTTAVGATIQGNRIGTDPSGSLAFGNVGHGLQLEVLNSLVGGSEAGKANVIAWNTRNGIYVTGATSEGNAIRQNSIFRNGQLGIDLLPAGLTANDLDDADSGPNRLQNFPEMTAAVLNGGTLTISYSVPSSTTNSTYPLAIEFFLGDTDNQEGQTYLGSHSYTSPGATTASLDQCCIPFGVRVVATATDADGNTSEFSSSIAVAAPLLASAVTEGGASRGAGLDASGLSPLVWRAIAAWESAGLDASQMAVLEALSFEIANLPGTYLGWATPDRIVLDVDAAGDGWHHGEGEERWTKDERRRTKDETPHVPFAGFDLLTAVMHEMGHVLGLSDLDDEGELMSGTLQPGTRRLPTTADVDRVLAGGDWLD
jgi:hypothetical protein